MHACMYHYAGMTSKDKTEFAESISVMSSCSMYNNLVSHLIGNNQVFLLTLYVVNGIPVHKTCML